MHMQTVPFNVTGNPALSMPAGRSDTGLPLSAQLVARSSADALLSRVGRAVERSPRTGRPSAFRPWPPPDEPGGIQPRPLRLPLAARQTRSLPKSVFTTDPRGE
jgi:hypothetical protein